MLLMLCVVRVLHILTRAHSQTLLATSMGALYFVQLFLNQIFTFSTVVIVGLGALLIYSLLLSNVEEKVCV
jgi:hypothetical protein